MSATDSDLTAPPPSEAAALVFGDELALARRYAERLAGDGSVRGLIGPREVPRLWDRHLVNCALLTDLLPEAAQVVDVGSGAGLPGLPAAIRRPDLRVTLVEPMLRRTAFLGEVIAELGLQDRVSVIRGRAEDRAVRTEIGRVDWVTARAVAPLDRLVGWCLPLLAPGGRLLALKGASAQVEADEHRAALRRAGVDELEVSALGAELPVDVTWVVSARRAVEQRASRVGRKR